MTLVVLSTMLAWPLAEAVAQASARNLGTDGTLDRRITSTPRRPAIAGVSTERGRLREARVEEFLTRLGDLGWNRSVGTSPENTAAERSDTVESPTKESGD